ncbi:hypothetical protein [Streptomyces sp. NPDC101181]|uniref:hypothetical protein n=1 Tax=Streptomyces sp. NPDC101181 TaxID=3366125 RepID=UPI003807D041
MWGDRADGVLVSRPESAAEARREVEFALYPLLCSPDVSLRPAHHARAMDASLVASELVGHVHHHTGSSRECLLVCLLHTNEITIVVTDPCDADLPRFPHPLDHGRAGLGSAFWSVVNRVAHQVDVQALPTGGRIISAAVALTGP